MPTSRPVLASETAKLAKVADGSDGLADSANGSSQSDPVALSQALSELAYRMVIGGDLRVGSFPKRSKLNDLFLTWPSSSTTGFPSASSTRTWRGSTLRTQNRFSGFALGWQRRRQENVVDEELNRASRASRPVVGPLPHRKVKGARCSSSRSLAANLGGRTPPAA